MVNTPYHNLAKWIGSILIPLRNELCRHTVKDSFEFSQKIQNLHIPKCKMCSFDVTSLFTNVPLEETVDYICEKMRVSNHSFPIPPTLLKTLILKCTKFIPFVCNGKFYQQIDGVAMGSPLGPILADIFMSKLEENKLAELISGVEYYARYVDDTFVICKERTSTRQMLKTLNNCHHSIKFTIEEETHDGLAFRMSNYVDVMMKRCQPECFIRALGLNNMETSTVLSQWLSSTTSFEI